MKTEQGFTIVELLVTLMVATLLLTLGVPAMRDFALDGRIVGQANEFVTSIQLARGTAIKQQRNATICVSTTWSNPTPTCTGGADWSLGWVVWVDQDQDSVLDSNEVLRVTEPLTASSAFEGTNTSFTYDPTGIVDAGDTLSLCDSRDDEIGRFISVTTMGRINMERTGVGCS